ncbi:MAG: hypothetical protein MK052_09370 [Alphaproteobacteria bacterium]|nr:hypothetical protein [Alphaproteobacteria bacterium]
MSAIKLHCSHCCRLHSKRYRDMLQAQNEARSMACENCQRTSCLEAIEVPDSPPASAGSDITESTFTAITIIAIFTIFGGLLYGCLRDSPEEKAAKAQSRKEAGYTVICQKALKRLLIHPSTADFDWGYKVAYPEHGVSVRVGVTASNSFGLAIHHTGVCDLTVNGTVTDARLFETR